MLSDDVSDLGMDVNGTVETLVNNGLLVARMFAGFEDYSSHSSRNTGSV